MADPEKALRAILVADSDITDLISTRVFPLTIPQKTSLPAMTYQLTSADPMTVMTGHDGLTFSTFFLGSFSTSYSTIKDLTEKVRLALDGTTGTYASVSVKEITHETTSDSYTPPQNKGEVGVYSTTLTVRMGYTSTIPS